jgi:hypothetical protein
VSAAKQQTSAGAGQFHYLAGDSTQRIHKSKTHPIGSGLTSRYQHGGHY